MRKEINRYLYYLYHRSEIARKEWFRMGKVPLQTLRAKIDYGFAEAMTLYGKIGVKAWVYKGEVLAGRTAEESELIKQKMAERAAPKTRESK